MGVGSDKLGGCLITNISSRYMQHTLKGQHPHEAHHDGRSTNYKQQSSPEEPYSDSEHKLSRMTITSFEIFGTV